MSRKSEIWETYLRYKRINDSRLSEFLSNEVNRKVIAKKDYDVVHTKRSKIYHKRNCSHLSRSRYLERMKRSDAILNGYSSCSRCINDFEGMTGIIICIVIVFIIMMIFLIPLSFD